MESKLVEPDLCSGEGDDRPVPLDEAEEDVDAAYQEADAKSESEGEGEDLDEHLEDDYQANQQLDRYDGVGIDNKQVRGMSYQERLQAEQEMRMRDRRENRQTQPGALMDMEEDYDEGDVLQTGVRQHFRG